MTTSNLTETEKRIVKKIFEDNFVEVETKIAIFTYEGKWYAPKFGCDTLDSVFEGFISAMREVRKELNLKMPNLTEAGYPNLDELLYPKKGKS